MPPSQLKRLKSSLREQGITGPQKSKKQKKSAKSSTNNDRAEKTAALQQIRDSFNPFELRAPSSRPAKFQHANTSNGGGKYAQALHRPGVSRTAGEEMRRKMLLPELQRRYKVGGVVDRRIGEGDVGMSAEERAMQRFVEEKGRKSAGGGVFDLEGSDDEDGSGMGLLTHGGKALGELEADDFAGLGGEDSASDDEGGLVRKKRRRSDVEEEGGDVVSEEDLEGEPEIKKSRREVMQEVVAKSKLHKYERQQAKEDDDDLREELDKGFGDVLALLRGHKPPPQRTPAETATNGTGEPTMNPDRLALLNGADRAAVAKQYDARLKQLAQDQKAKPSDRTKTEEEKIQEEAERLKNLEERRAKRMRGEHLSDDEHEASKETGGDGVEDEMADDAAEFGFTSSNLPQMDKEEKVVLEDEDEFALDEDLIASGSEIDMSDGSASDNETDAEASSQPNANDEEDEFVNGILGDGGESKANDAEPVVPHASGQGLAFTYPCPRSHQELLDVIKDSPIDRLPVVIQRIRALHHPSLSTTNKEAMADFSSALVEHFFYMGEHGNPLAVTEQVIRHLHSLSRTYPEVIAAACRRQIREAHERKHLGPGDLIVLTAVGSIYPTSDHFHAVVTPAMTLMAKWLAINVPPDTAHRQSTGVFLVALSLHYQRLSKRYIPEALRFTLQALSSKSAPTKDHLSAHLTNLNTMLTLWKTSPAFSEIFAPFLTPLTTKPLSYDPSTKSTLQALRILLTHARTARQPLKLHNHRPLAIRTSIPKFEEGFNPEKHYDPDKDRSDARKLMKEVKRERKGAVRELRKDANFLAREGLREKRVRDEEHERKQRRLIAEIQGEASWEAREGGRREGGGGRGGGGRGRGGRGRGRGGR